MLQRFGSANFFVKSYLWGFSPLQPAWLGEALLKIRVDLSRSNVFFPLAWVIFFLLHEGLCLNAMVSWTLRGFVSNLSYCLKVHCSLSIKNPQIFLKASKDGMKFVQGPFSCSFKLVKIFELLNLVVCFSPKPWIACKGVNSDASAVLLSRLIGDINRSCI